jgi:arabinofuranan 3-O-arabinosyltransferase
VRSIASIPSRPNEQFVLATISRINNSQYFVEVDVDVPRGDRRALLIFSRPYFRGYQARLGKQELTVTSYRGLFPTVEVPAGVHGWLTLIYRPSWLEWGGSLAVACGLIVLLGVIAAYRYSSSATAESGR